MATARPSTAQPKVILRPPDRGRSLAASPSKPSPAQSAWTYPYALYRAAANPTDSLLLVYAAILGIRPEGVAAVDAIGSVGSVVGLLALGRVADRVGAQRLLVSGMFLAAGGVMAAAAFTSETFPLIGLSLVWGFFFAAPTPMSSVIITRLFPRSRWTDQQVRLSTLDSLGQTVGFAIAVLWLLIAGRFLGDLAAVRIFFFIAAGLSLLAAIAALLLVPKKTAAAVTAPSAAGTVRRGHAASTGPPYNDRLKSLLAVSAILFLGLGMVGTVLPLYLTQGLHAKSYVVMAASLISMVAATLGLRMIGGLMARLSSLRLYALAIGVRGTLVLGIGLSAVVFPVGVAPWAVLGIMPLAGVCSAAVSASSSTRLVNLAPAGHKGGASGQYSAVTFVAMTLGAFLGGLSVQHLGFLPTFSLAAAWLFVASLLALRL